VLQLENNRLEILPDTIGDLPLLRLDLSNNSLRFLPNSLVGALCPAEDKTRSILFLVMFDLVRVFRLSSSSSMAFTVLHPQPWLGRRHGEHKAATSASCFLGR
jgi:Leucine-rich repeat (LRR) protein